MVCLLAVWLLAVPPPSTYSSSVQKCPIHTIYVVSKSVVHPLSVLFRFGHPGLEDDLMDRISHIFVRRRILAESRAERQKRYQKKGHRFRENTPRTLLQIYYPGNPDRIKINQVAEFPR